MLRKCLKVLHTICYGDASDNEDGKNLKALIQVLEEKDWETIEDTDFYGRQLTFSLDDFQKAKGETISGEDVWEFLANFFDYNIIWNFLKYDMLILAGKTDDFTFFTIYTKMVRDDK